MLHKIRKISQSSFARSSGALFVINNLNNLFNYGLILVAKIFLTNGFGLWISITSFLAITTVPLSSFTAVLSKKTAELAEKDEQAPFLYLRSINQHLRRIIKYYVWASPLLVIAMYYLLRFDSILIPIYIVILLLLTLLLGINNNFLLGLLKIREYSIVNLTLLFFRISATIILLIAGFQVTALPIGSIFAFSIGLILSYQLIKSIATKTKINAIKEIDDSQLSANVNLDWKDLMEVSKALGYMLFLSLLLNSDTVLSRTLLTSNENETYGIISIFGQIAHFGPISFSTALIPFAVKQKNNNIYLVSVGIVLFLSGLVWLVFLTAGNLLLDALNVADTSTILPKILFYSVFITFYNLIFVSTNYLIGRGVYNILKYLFILLGIYLTTLVTIGSGLFNQLNSDFSKVNGFIGVNILFSSFIAVGLFFYIIYAKHLDQQPESKRDQA